MTEDPLLSQVHHLVLHGWRVTNPDANLQPYFNRRDEVSLAVWWAGIDASVVGTVCGCTVCQDYRPTPAKAPLYLWEWPT